MFILLGIRVNFAFLFAVQWVFLYTMWKRRIP